MSREFDEVLKQVLPKSKLKHSKRVANKLWHMPKVVKDAALFHDYLERGGTVESISPLLHKDSIKLIKLLTNENGLSPIKHIKNILSDVNDDTLKEFLILIKIADRKDNYTKRIKNKTITKKYKKKTKELLSFLLSQYKGDVKNIKLLK